MAITFPSNPADGDTYSHGGVTYTWDASPGYWKGQFSVPTIPSSLSDLGITDGTNGQVLSTNGSGAFSFTTLDTPSSFGAWSSTQTVSATGYNNGTTTVSATIPSGTKGIFVKGSVSTANNSGGNGRLFVNGTQRAYGSAQSSEGGDFDTNYCLYIDASTGSGTFFLIESGQVQAGPGTSWVGSGSVTSLQVQGTSTSSEKNCTHSTNIYYS